MCTCDKLLLHFYSFSFFTNVCPSSAIGTSNCMFCVCVVQIQDFNILYSRTPHFVCVWSNFKTVTFCVLGLHILCVWFVEKCCGHSWLLHTMSSQPQPWRVYQEAQNKNIKNRVWTLLSWRNEKLWQCWLPMFGMIVALETRKEAFFPCENSNIVLPHPMERHSFLTFCVWHWRQRQLGPPSIFLHDPRREAGDVWCSPPVWNLRAVIWFPFPISSCIFCLVLLLFLSCHFSANRLHSPDFFPENSNIFR